MSTQHEPHATPASLAQDLDSAAAGTPPACQPTARCLDTLKARRLPARFRAFRTQLAHYSHFISQTETQKLGIVE